MTVHTHIHGRNARLFAVLCTAVAVQAVDLVGAGVYFMRVEDGLFGLVILLAAQSNGAVNRIVPSHQEERQDARPSGMSYCGRGTGSVRYAFFLVELAQVAVHL